MMLKQLTSRGLQQLLKPNQARAIQPLMNKQMLMGYNQQVSQSSYQIITIYREISPRRESQRKRMKRSPRKRQKLLSQSIKNLPRKSLIFLLHTKVNQLNKYMSLSSRASQLVRSSKSILLQIISHQLKRTLLKEDMPLYFSLQPQSKNLFSLSMRISYTLNLFMTTQNHSSSSLKTLVLEQKRLLPSTLL